MKRAVYTFVGLSIAVSGCQVVEPEPSEPSDAVEVQGIAGQGMLVASNDSLTHGPASTLSPFLFEPEAPDPGCEIIDSTASCKLRRCAPPQLNAVSAPEEIFSAGRVTVVEHERPRVWVVESEEGDEPFSKTYRDGYWLTPGKTYSFEVGGTEDIPPHSAVLVAPAPIMVGAPTVDPDDPCPGGVYRNQELNVNWYGENGEEPRGVVVVTVTVPEPDGSRLEVQCVSDAADQLMLIPSALLLQLPAHDEADEYIHATLAVESYVEEVVTVNDWTTTFRLRAEARGFQSLAGGPLLLH